jgi:RNA polymerase sigma-70 factor (ECF subfamily)
VAALFDVTPDQERDATKLMELAQHGDREAYASVLVLAAAAVKRMVKHKWGNVVWADDAVQETLISVHRARHTFDPSRPFAPWLYAIAHNRIIDVARRERRIGDRELGTDVLPEPAVTAPDAAARIDPDRVRAALASLPDRQRDVIVGMKFGDESVRDIGARLKMSNSAVKATAHRGYKVLRRLLGEHRDGD